MVQPKYNPEEALQRIKLMMEYDSSKTLSENKKVIEEQTAGNLADPTTLAAGASGAVVGAGVAGGLTAGAAAGTAIFPVVGTAIGAVAGVGLGMLINWWNNKDYGEKGFKQVMSACSSKGASKLVPQLSKADIRNIAYSIEDAKGQWNDDESAIKSALERIPTVGDLCAVDKKVTGGLYQFLNDLTDSPDEWKMFTRPLEGMIEDTEFVANPEEVKKTDTNKTGGGNKTGGYKSCTGTYSYGCKSDVIAKVQGCLGLVTDGKFGPKTKASLSGKGFENGFTDADVTKICEKQETKLTSDVDIETLGTADNKVTTGNKVATDNNDEGQIGIS